MRGRRRRQGRGAGVISGPFPYAGRDQLDAPLPPTPAMDPQVTEVGLVLDSIDFTPAMIKYRILQSSIINKIFIRKS